MIIEIRGVQFFNKGAELMLHAILDSLKKRLSKVKFTIAPNLDNCKFEEITRLGIYPKVWLEKFRIQWGYLADLVPNKFRRTYGLVADSEVDVIIDASGFAYGDQWGPTPTMLLAKYIKKWKKQGKKVILLPQAFGPFSTPKICKAFTNIIECADLIYAREDVSYKHLVQLNGKNNKIKISPDFTNLIPGIVPKYFDKRKHQFCIVPNKRMIDKTSVKDSSLYANFISECINILLKRNIQPFFLIHGGKEDGELICTILNKLGKHIEIFSENNVHYIKGIIGASVGLIGSRYHSIVSALSQGVPTLGTGWSHKYQTLFNEYDFEEGLIPLDTSMDDLEKKIDMIVSVKSSEAIKNKLLMNSKKQKKLALKMWDEVTELIKQ